MIESESTSLVEWKKIEVRPVRVSYNLNPGRILGQQLQSVLRIVGCLLPDPDFCPSGSQIPDPKTATKERGEKKFVVLPFFVATKSQNFKLY
jgi:hypothetical protein